MQTPAGARWNTGVPPQTDIEGRILKSTYGNSVSDNYTYNTRTGRLTGIHSAAPYVIAYRRLRYSYDSMNNVLSRNNLVKHKLFCAIFSDFIEAGQIAANSIATRSDLVKIPIVYEELFSDQFAPDDFRLYQAKRINKKQKNYSAKTEDKFL